MGHSSRHKCWTLLCVCNLFDILLYNKWHCSYKMLNYYFVAVSNIGVISVKCLLLLRLFVANMLSMFVNSLHNAIFHLQTFGRRSSNTRGDGANKTKRNAWTYSSKPRLIKQTIEYTSQATYVQNIFKLYARLITQAESVDDWDTVSSLDNILTSKLPQFEQTDHLEAQERVRHTYICRYIIYNITGLYTRTNRATM
jgi:hypothetical protein